MKAVMLALSSFQEVLLLDADQVPVRDVTPLYSDPGYLKTGALLWPDFWDASWAPDAADALGIKADDLPSGTFESGQMLLDKARCVLNTRRRAPAAHSRHSQHAVFFGDCSGTHAAVDISCERHARRRLGWRMGM